jgi:NAD(P)-dependent dehydrogenase (short-subunit alcohol dehydrogenase family)
MTSTDTKTWLVTGAGRGMGVDFTRAALTAGHNVVATGRNLDTVRTAIGGHELAHDDVGVAA